MLVNLVPAICILHTYMYNNEDGDGLKVMLLVEELGRGSKIVDRAMDSLLVESGDESDDYY